MTRSSVTRRLAAILVADVVGFSRHMERDDEGTFARLRDVHASIVDPTIADYGGRVVKTAGDAILAEFASAGAALRCAIEVQRAMSARPARGEARDEIEFRIGINIGDVIVDGDDIFGDGVNVAARLEALAVPGGICVSAAVREQMHGSVDVRFVDTGEQRVKNIARPIRTYAVDLTAARAEHGDAAAEAMPQALPAPAHAADVAASSSSARTMSIGVLPLVALSGGAPAAQGASALTRELSAMLARTGSLISVVPLSSAHVAAAAEDSRDAARRLNVRYLAEGDVQGDEGATRLELRIVDGSTGEQVWSETAVFDEAAGQAARSRALHTAVWHLSRALLAAELRRVAARSAAPSAPGDDVLRAILLDRTESEWLDRLRKKESLLDAALAREPNLVAALLALAIVFNQRIEFDICSDRDLLVRRMDELTAKALRLNETQPTTWFVRSVALMHRGQWQASLEACARAVGLEPWSSMLVLHQAWLTMLTGRPADALALAEESLAMDPQGNSAQFALRCEALSLLGQYAAATSAGERARGLGGDEGLSTLLCLVAAYAHAGEHPKAHAARDEVLRLVPGYTIGIHQHRRDSHHPEYVRLLDEHLYSGLRKAGFPEA